MRRGATRSVVETFADSAGSGGAGSTWPPSVSVGTVAMQQRGGVEEEVAQPGVERTSTRPTSGILLDLGDRWRGNCCGSSRSRGPGDHDLMHSRNLI